MITIFIYNIILGEFSYQFSDLIAPADRTPRFAQVYTLSPESAKELRVGYITDVLDIVVREEIMNTLEKLMRENPLGQTFVTVGEQIETAKAKNNGELPHFQVTTYVAF